MAVNFLTNANYLDDDWQDEITSKNLQKKGWLNINITAIDTTTYTISNGSTWDCNGVIYYLDADFTDTFAAKTGTWFLIFDASNNSFSLDNTDPVWDWEKNGFYLSSTKRQIARIDFTNKVWWILANNTAVRGNQIVTGNIENTGTLKVGSTSTFTGRGTFTGGGTFNNTIIDKNGKEVLAVKLESQHYDTSATVSTGMQNWSKTFTFSGSVEAVVSVFAGVSAANYDGYGGHYINNTIISGSTVQVDVGFYGSSTYDPYYMSIDICVKLV